MIPPLSAAYKLEVSKKPFDSFPEHALHHRGEEKPLTYTIGVRKEPLDPSPEVCI